MNQKVRADLKKKFFKMKNSSKKKEKLSFFLNCVLNFNKEHN